MSAAASRPDLDELQARFLRAQLRGDRREASQIVLDEGLARGVSVQDLHERVLQRSQIEIGRLWQENAVSIAEEHMATAIANLVLTLLFERAAPAPRNGKSVVVACVEGELHEFPARLVADALDLAGFRVRYLGASCPTKHLLLALEQDKPDLLALSATMSFHAPALKDAIACVHERFGDSLPLAVGGGAIAWGDGSLPRSLGVAITGVGAYALVARAEELLGVRA